MENKNFCAFHSTPVLAIAQCDGCGKGLCRKHLQKLDITKTKTWNNFCMECSNKAMGPRRMVTNYPEMTTRLELDHSFYKSNPKTVQKSETTTNKTVKSTHVSGKTREAIFLENYKKKEERTVKEEWLNRNFYIPPHKTGDKQKAILKDARGKEFEGTNIYIHVILYELIRFTGILLIVGFLQFRTIYYNVVLGIIEGLSGWDLSWVNILTLVIYVLMIHSLYLFFVLPESRINKAIGVLITGIIWLIALYIVSGMFNFDPTVYYLPIGGYVILSSLISQLNIPEGVLSIRYEKA